MLYYGDKYRKRKVLKFFFTLTSEIFNQEKKLQKQNFILFILLSSNIRFQEKKYVNQKIKKQPNYSCSYQFRLYFYFGSSLFNSTKLPYLEEKKILFVSNKIYPNLTYICFNELNPTCLIRYYKIMELSISTTALALTNFCIFFHFCPHSLKLC